MVEFVAAVSSNVEIFEPVVVVVSDRYAHAVASAFETSLFGYVFEAAIGFLVVQAVPVIWTTLLRDEAFRSRILKGRAIDQKNVEATVVVVIKQGDAATHGFEQIMLDGVRREVVEMD